MLFTIKLTSPLKLASSNSSTSAAQGKETSSFTAGTESFGAINVTEQRLDLLYHLLQCLLSGFRVTSVLVDHTTFSM